MKSSKNLLEQLKSLPHFGKSAVYQMGKQLGLEEVTVDVYISRFLKRQEIFRLKNGLYVSADFFGKNKGEISYSFYLANVIRTPSYVSSWAALQHYGLVTESIYPVTSVTPKVTRDYRTKAGDFAYQSIKKELFTGFSLVTGKFGFFMASPAKALFDLLYFRTRQFRSIPAGGVEALVVGLRIDIDEMDGVERDKFHAMIRKYE